MYEKPNANTHTLTKLNKINWSTPTKIKTKTPITNQLKPKPKTKKNKQLSTGNTLRNKNLFIDFRKTAIGQEYSINTDATYPYKPPRYGQYGEGKNPNNN